MARSGADLMHARSPDLSNARSSLAASFENNRSLTNLSPVQGFRAEIGLELVAQNLIAPMMVTSPNDGTKRRFLVDQIGLVKIVDKDGTVLPEPFLDLRDDLVKLSPRYDERGLLSIAFHPDYRNNGKVYVFYSAPTRPEAPKDWSCTNHISVFQVDSTDPNKVDMSSEEILMYIDKPYENHNGGQLVFGPTDGYLYISLGDGGKANDVGNGHTKKIGNSQDLTKIYGKILRINVDNTDTGSATIRRTLPGDANVNQTEDPPEPTWTTFAGDLYGIPSDNPFAQTQPEILDSYAYDTVPPEIYAYGLRNPAYMGFDSGGDNALFVGEAGQNLFESVTVILKGGNYGWNIHEGTHCFDPDKPLQPPETCDTTGFLDEPLIGPLFEGGHDLGLVVVGGYVYRGNAVPELQGRCIFGYWSDSRMAGNGILLVATPPEGWYGGVRPSVAADLTPEANIMWESQKLKVSGRDDEFLGMFVRGFGEDADGEMYVATNETAGPDTSASTGKVWKIVPPVSS